MALGSSPLYFRFLQAKNNIHVNCVVPVASSRMTETVLPQEVLKMLDPSLVSPIVTFLAHDSCKHTGDCYEVGGGWFSKVRSKVSVLLKFCTVYNIHSLFRSVSNVLLVAVWVHLRIQFPPK